MNRSSLIKKNFDEGFAEFLKNVSKFIEATENFEILEALKLIEEEKKFKEVNEHIYPALKKLSSIKCNNAEVIEIAVLTSSWIEIFWWGSSSFVHLMFEILTQNEEAFKESPEHVEIIANHIALAIQKRTKFISDEADRISISLLVKALNYLQTTYITGLAGCIEILKLSSIVVVYGSEYRDVTAQIDQIFRSNIRSTHFNENFFKNDQNNEDFWIGCSYVAKRLIKEKDIKDEEKSMFCCSVLKAFGEQAGSEYVQFYIDITEAIYEIIIQNGLDIVHFLVKGMLSDKNFLSQTCNILLIQILTTLINEEDTEEIGSCYKYFQEILCRNFDPSITALDSRRDMIFHILTTLYDMNDCAVLDLMNEKVALMFDFYVDNKQDISDLEQAIAVFEDSPFEDNYRKLLAIVRGLEIEKFSKAQVESFDVLIELVERICLCKQFSLLLHETLKAILKCENIDVKVKFLMKLKKIISSELPPKGKLLVLEIIVGCLNEKRLHCGLEKFIDDALKRLLNKSFLHIAWNFMVEDTGNDEKHKIDEQTMQQLVKEEKKRLSRKRKAVDIYIERNLASIARYSEWLNEKSKKFPRSKRQQELIDKIITNLQPLRQD